MLCIKKRDEQTDEQTDGQTNNPETICPSNFFEVGGIKTEQEDHDGPKSLTWPNRFAYLLLKFQPSSLL